jgi:hypothetical protein
MRDKCKCDYHNRKSKVSVLYFVCCGLNTFGPSNVVDIFDPLNGKCNTSTHSQTLNYRDATGTAQFIAAKMDFYLCKKMTFTKNIF